jgi:hypothetical protein
MRSFSRRLGEPGLNNKKKIVIIVKGNLIHSYTPKCREKHLKYLSIVDRLLRGIGEPRGVLFFSKKGEGLKRKLSLFFRLLLLGLLNGLGSCKS